MAAARLLHRRHPAGAPLSAALLVTLLVLSVAMVASVPAGVVAGLHEQPETAGQLIAFGIVFTLLGAAQAWLLVRGNRRTAEVPCGWLRPGWWPTDRS